MIFAKVSAESARIARDLAGLLTLGYPLVEALGKLETTCDGTFRPRLQKLVEEVRTGTLMGEALGRDPGPFPSTFVSSIQLAERTEEKFPEALLLTAETLEETSDRVTATTLASLYPAVVATFLVFLVALLIPFLSSELELIQDVFSSEPSAISQLYFQLGSALRHPLGWLAFFLTILGVWRFCVGTSVWRFRLPIYGPWLAGNQAVLFLRWCDHLLRLGLPLPEAVRLAATSCSAPLDSLYLQAASKVEQGSPLSRALLEISVVPSMAVWLVEQEEARESLDLRSVADFLSWELDTTQARGAAAIEPVALMTIGATLLFVCLATQSAFVGILNNL